MKKIFVLSMLVSFVMICACQKQDSAAEQQLAQRQVELDAREKASAERLNSLEEKVNSLDQSVKALAGKQKDTVNAPGNPADVQDQAQVQAERDLMIQQLPTPSQLNADEKQRRLEAAGVSPEPQ
jgi:uncharacterized protein YlxW (UPF0749 family)